MGKYDYTVHFAYGEEEITKVYSYDSGRMCTGMTGLLVEGISPATVFGGFSDTSVVVLRHHKRGYFARAVANTDTKKFHRVYAASKEHHDALNSWLIGQGFTKTPDFLLGAKLNLVLAPSGKVIMPYLDGNHRGIAFDPDTGAPVVVEDDHPCAIGHAVSCYGYLESNSSEEEGILDYVYSDESYDFYGEEI